MRKRTLSTAAVSGLLVIPALYPVSADAQPAPSGIGAAQGAVARPGVFDTTCPPVRGGAEPHECRDEFRIEPGERISVRLTGGLRNLSAEFEVFDQNNRQRGETEEVDDSYTRLWTNNTRRAVEVVLKADPSSRRDNERTIRATVRVQKTEPRVRAADLLSKVKECNQVSNGKYKKDEDSRRARVPVCETDGAVFWKADMDISCDGQVTEQCNRRTDRSFLNDTAFQQSNGEPLNAEELPYVVVPGASRIWNYREFGIRGGGVVAVIYRNRVEFAVVGDIGPRRIIGEASYATAQSLGIDPDPNTGGTQSGVTYILFKDSQVDRIENHRAAVRLGRQLAKQFIQNN